MEKWCCHNAVNLVSNVYKFTEPCRQTMNHLEINHMSLMLKRRQLIGKVKTLKSQVTAAQQLGRNPDNEVIGWLNDAGDRLTILNDVLGAEDAPLGRLPPKCPGGCLYVNCFSAYQYAKKLEDMVAFVDQLIKSGEFSGDKIFKSNPAAPGPSRDVADQIVGMDDKLGQVYTLLQEPGFSSVAIHGMGGVGKTTLMTRVHQRLLEDSLGYDEDMIIWVDMSHVNSNASARLAIGEKLGLTTFENAVNKGQISTALQGKKFVLLLDDLRDVRRLELEGIGIPMMSIKSKVVFTTRHSSLCHRMGAESADQQIQLECLTGEDPWTLFKNVLRLREPTVNCDPAFLASAEKVSNYCRGLPLALHAMGSSMRGNTSPNEWKLAEKRLETLHLDSYGLDEDVFKVLNISYQDLLEPSKSCFLYASLFPETCLQHEDDLIHYWISEEILTEFHQLNDNLIHGRSVIENLRRSNLLEHDDGTKIVKMHGMMRGAALWTSKGKFYVSWDDTLDGLPTSIDWGAVERVSLVRNSIDKLTQIPFNHLSTLILKNSTVRQISYDFFDSMPCLNVLDLSGSNMENFPLGIVNLTTLRYLNISHTRIQDLPTELKKLSLLKFLDLSYLPLLYRIPRQVLADLNRLQSLDLYHSGTGKKIQQCSNILAPEDEGNVLSKDSHALLTELEQLNHLDSLGITIRSLPALQNLQKSKHLRCLHSMFITKCKGLKSLQVLSSDNHTIQNLKVFRVSDCPDLMELAIPSEQCFGNLYRIEIQGCGKLMDISWINYAPCLHSLKIENCSGIEVVVSNVSNTTTTKFSSLRFIHLSYLPELKLFCNLGLSLPALEQITVLYCPKMEKLPIASENTQRALKSIIINKNLWDKLVWDGESAKPALGHLCEFK